MTDLANVRSAVQTGDETFGAKIRAGDAAGVAALYSDTAMLLPPGSDTVTGRDNIQGFWQAVMNMGIKDAKLEPVEVEAFGDTAIEIGKYTLKLEGGHTADQGKYVVVWKQEAGVWKLHRDVWNTSMSPAKV